MNRHLLPEPRPLGLHSPRRSPPSCLGSLTSVRLRRRMRNHDIHCRKLKPRQHRHDVATALALNHALLAGQGSQEVVVGDADWQFREIWAGWQACYNFAVADKGSWKPDAKVKGGLILISIARVWHICAQKHGLRLTCVRFKINVDTRREGVMFCSWYTAEFFNTRLSACYICRSGATSNSATYMQPPIIAHDQRHHEMTDTCCIFSMVD